MRRSNYEVVIDDIEKIVLRDLGPWNKFLSITNDAENVARDLEYRLNGRKLLYYDSEGELTGIDVPKALEYFK